MRLCAHMRQRCPTSWTIVLRLFRSNLPQVSTNIFVPCLGTLTLAERTLNFYNMLMSLWMTSLDWRRGHGTAIAMSAKLCFVPLTKFSALSTLRIVGSGRKSCPSKS